jgi:methylated-DNA-[protein]-cysteine S-methyltransferase
MALGVAAGGAVRRLAFGYASAAAAMKAVGATGRTRRDFGTLKALVARLRRFAAGAPDDLLDVPLDLGPCTEFQRRVLEACRHVPYGQTVSYGELAARAGFSRTARAVGCCMAANRIPLLVPCHRVIRSDGRPGHYSAPGGARMKRRLLTLESRAVTRST